jgi:hypothetical protein
MSKIEQIDIDISEDGQYIVAAGHTDNQDITLVTCFPIMTEEAIAHWREAAAVIFQVRQQLG